MIKKILLFSLIFLVACAAPPLTMPPTLVVTLQPTLTSTVYPPLLQTSTIAPSLVPTLNQTQVAHQQIEMATQSVFQTEVAQFPHSCLEHYTPYFSEKKQSLSPDGLWLAEECTNPTDNHLMLAFSNKKTQVVWTMLYHRYIPKTTYADGIIAVTHWSNDSRYAYFYTTLGGDGGECFRNGYDTGNALFRLDLQTGETKEILPPTDQTWYGFSFSPTDRRMVYGTRAVNLALLDLTTGKSIPVAHQKAFSDGGGYVWSPDGLTFIYATVNHLSDEGIKREYALRLVDAKTGAERILLNSTTQCYDAIKWQENNIIQIESNDENFNTMTMEYDFNSNTFVDASATPAP